MVQIGDHSENGPSDPTTPHRRTYRLRRVNLPDYQEYLVGRGLSPRTVAIYTSYVEKASDWCRTHGRELEQLSAFDLAALPDEISRGGSASARRQIRSALQHMYEMIGRPDAPTHAIRVPPKPDPINRSVTEEEARRLVAVAYAFGYPRGTAVLMGMYQALRRAEIAVMRWEYIDNPIPGHLKVIGTKGTGIRHIPLHPRLGEHLAALREPRGWMFPGRGVDGPIIPNTINKWVRDIADKAGLPAFHPHRMRHTVLSAMNDHTGDIRAVATFAGHKRLETTMAYTRTTDERMRQAQGGVGW